MPAGLRKIGRARGSAAAGLDLQPSLLARTGHGVGERGRCQRFRTAFVVLVPAMTLVVMLAAGLAIVRGQAGQAAQGRTAWDGVYSEAQADRATGTFDRECANCHSLTAQGSAALAGAKFWESFSQKSVGSLLTYVRTNMPNGRGGSLPASTYLDLVALILKANGFPAGASEFDPDALDAIAIVPRDGSSELPNNALARVVGCLERRANEWVLTRATVPRRIEGSGGPDPADATRPLGDRSTPLKFVLTPLDAFVGKRLSISGMLIGAGGVDGLNVTTVNRVAETCP
jgi:mono/diheme cytochrome c family protein